MYCVFTRWQEDRRPFLTMDNIRVIQVHQRKIMITVESRMFSISMDDFILKRERVNNVLDIPLYR